MLSVFLFRRWRDARQNGGAVPGVPDPVDLAAKYRQRLVRPEPEDAGERPGLHRPG